MTKNISLTEEAYGRLTTIKQPGESFSDEILRMTSRGSIMEFFGAWKDIPDDEIKKMKERIREGRKDRSRIDEIEKKMRGH